MPNLEPELSLRKVLYLRLVQIVVKAHECVL